MNIPKNPDNGGHGVVDLVNYGLLPWSDVGPITLF